MYSDAIIAEIQLVLQEDYGFVLSREEAISMANGIVGVFGGLCNTDTK